MAERKSWAVGAVAGVGQVNELDARITLGGLVVPAGAITSRGGLFPAATPGQVTATSPTPNALVHVAPFRGVIQSARPAGGGTYLMCLDAIKDIDVLATPAHPTNARNDLIVFQQSDTFHADANSNFVVRHVVGTPSGSPIDPDPTAGGFSTDYVVAARIVVPANATTITTGDITNMALPWTVAAGGLLPIRSGTERTAITAPYEGMPIYRTDRDWTEIYDGAAWRVQGTAVCSSTADRDSAITSPYNGQLAYTSDTGIIWQRHSGAWRIAHPRGIIGGHAITGGNNLGAAITTTETMPTNMHSGTVNLEANRRHKIRARYKALGSVATDVWVMRIREGASAGTSGNQIREYVQDTVATTFGFTWEFEGEYETGGSAVSRVFSLTAQRVGGTGNIQFTGGGTTSTNLVGVWVEDVGPAGLLTSTTS